MGQAQITQNVWWRLRNLPGLIPRGLPGGKLIYFYSDLKYKISKLIIAFFTESAKSI